MTELNKNENANVQISVLIRRIQLLLEDSEFQKADVYAEKILDLDPECARAYFYKTLIDFKCKDKKQLIEILANVSENRNFAKAMRFATGELHEELENIPNMINEQIGQINYGRAIDYLNAGDENSVLKAAQIFKRISGFKDSDEKFEMCRNVYKEIKYNIACQLLSTNRFDQAKSIFDYLKDYNDSAEKSIECENSKIEYFYNNGTLAFNAKKYAKAKKMLVQVKDYKDANEKIAECETKIKKKNKIVTVTTAIIIICTILIGSIVGITLQIIKDKDTDGLIVEKVGEEYVVTGYKETKSTYIIPEKVNRIENGAFRNHKELTKITIPSNVKYIGDSAFEDCTNLEKVTIKDGIKNIGKSAFKDCTSLENIKIGKTLEYLGDRAFYNCKKIKTINLDNNITEIQQSTFRNCSSLKEIVLTSKVKTIYSYAFENCNEFYRIFYKGDSADIRNLYYYRTGNAALLDSVPYYYSERKPYNSLNRWHYDEDNNIVFW